MGSVSAPMYTEHNSSEFFLAQALFVLYFSLNMVFNRAALANILVAVAELLLSVGKLISLSLNLYTFKLSYMPPL